VHFGWPPSPHQGMPPASQYAPVPGDEAGDAPARPRASSCCGVARRHRPQATMLVCLLTAFIYAVSVGLGRIVALHDCSST
jgi:hypothetical protein